MNKKQGVNYYFFYIFTCFLLGSDHEEDLDKEFAQLAKRNTLKNTNPFKAVL